MFTSSKQRHKRKFNVVVVQVVTKIALHVQNVLFFICLLITSRLVSFDLLILPGCAWTVRNQSVTYEFKETNTINLECKEVRDQFLESLIFSIHFLSFWYCRITENGWEKTDHGLLCTPVLVYRFFELVSYSFQRESIKYVNSGRISGPWIPIQIF